MVQFLEKYLLLALNLKLRNNTETQRVPSVVIEFVLFVKTSNKRVKKATREENKTRDAQVLRLNPEQLRLSSFLCLSFFKHQAKQRGNIW